MSMRGLFAGLDEATVSGLLAGGVRRRFSPGEAIVVEGGPPGAIYVVEAGEAVARASASAGRPGRELGRIVVGDVIGEMSLLTGQPASATVWATTRVDAVQLTQADLWRIGGQHPVLFQNIARILAERLQTAQLETLDVDPVD